MIDPQAMEAMSRTNFSPVDAIIVGAYLLVSVAIGLMVRKYVSDMTSYIGAGRKVGAWLGVASMTGTELGLVTVMYSAQKGFTGGFAAFHIALVAGAVCFLIGVTGFIVVPMRRHRVLTIPEYYEKRFDRKTRVLGGIILSAAGILNMGLFLKVGSMFIVGVTGLSSAGWALPAVMVTLLVLVLLYTTLGGMISVILTDYIQFVVLSAALLIGTGMAIAHIGWEDIFRAVEEVRGEAGFNPVAEGSTFGWAYIAWMAIGAGLISCAVWPTAMARVLAMESEGAVKRQYRWSALSFVIRFLIPNFWGICALAYITTSPEGSDLKPLFFPAAPGGTKAVDNLYAMPVFMGRLLPPVLLGFVTAGMLAAFMSTHDSYLLCWSSVITQDIVAPLRRNRNDGRGMTTRARVRLTRVLIVAIGIYILYWGLFYEGRQDIWDYMIVTGSIYANGAIALLAGGLYWKRASSTGAFLALLAGCSAVLALEPVKKAVGGAWLAPCGEAEIGLMSVALTLTVMVAGSFVFPDKPKTGNES